MIIGSKFRSGWTPDIAQPRTAGILTADGRGTTMRPYLVCHDYGTGGVWWWITAASPDEITSKFRDVTVFEEPPPWWSDELERLTPRRLVGDKPDEVLTSLVR